MSNTALKIEYIDEESNQEVHLPITVFKKPASQKEYTKLEKVFDQLNDEIKDNDKHPLAIALQIIGENLEQYDNEQSLPIGGNVNNVQLVKFLMESNDLVQSDLADIFGGQANVSKFLSGERELSKNQIAGLKKRFGISADFFF